MTNIKLYKMIKVYNYICGLQFTRKPDCYLSLSNWITGGSGTEWLAQLLRHTYLMLTFLITFPTCRQLSWEEYGLPGKLSWLEISVPAQWYLWWKQSELFGFLGPLVCLIPFQSSYPHHSPTIWRHLISQWFICISSSLYSWLRKIDDLTSTGV